jgi:hypothetical protein
MKTRFGASAVAAFAIVSAMVIGTALPAAAHEAVGPPGLTCDEASVQLKDFPQSSSTVTFHVKVNGVENTKSTPFSGPSGTASVAISDLTTATGSLDISAFASWTIDGGGKSATTEITKVCHEKPPPTSETPPTSGGPKVIDVGGIQAARPASSAPSEPAAAVAVADQPRFTG